MSRIVIATANIGFEQRVRRVFDGSLNGDLSRWRADDLLIDPDRTVKELAAKEPDVIVLGPDIPINDALEVARLLYEDRPEISLIITTKPTPDLWEQAMHAGVRGVISPDATDQELRREFDRGIDTTSRQRQNLAPSQPGDGPSGRVITVLAPKGGSGKTAIATNLSVALAAARPDEVVLTDLDLEFGDTRSALRLTPEHSIADAAAAPGKLDPATLKVFLTGRGRGLYALCAPNSPAQGEEITDGDVRQILELLRTEFPFVVVDTAAGIDERVLSAVELSTDLILVCDLSLAGVQGLKKLIDALDRLGMTTASRHFVLNRADARVGLDGKEVAAIVGMKIDASVPSSRLVPLSMNQGTPVIEAAPRSPVAHALSDLATRFTEVAARPGFLERMRRR
jgi:pilus assembly protein CpaE